MRGPRSEPLFLARETYRRRRVMDAARFLPAAAAFLFTVPVLWARSTGTAAGMLYLFGAWLVLILVAGAVARALPYLRGADRDDAAGGDGEAP